MRITLPTAIAAGLFVWLTGSNMPTEVASHFNASGQADSFLSRDNYLTLMILVICLSTLVVGGIGRLLISLPEDSINLPDKAYWLSPERKNYSLNYISNWLQFFSAGMAAFLCFVHWIVVQANSTEPKQLDSSVFYFGLVFMLLGLIGSIYALVRRFTKTID